VGSGNPGAMAALDADARLKAAATWEAAIKGVTSEMFADVVERCRFTPGSPRLVSALESEI